MPALLGDVPEVAVGAAFKAFRQQLPCDTHNNKNLKKVFDFLDQVYGRTLCFSQLDGDVKWEDVVSSATGGQGYRTKQEARGIDFFSALDQV